MKTKSRFTFLSGLFIAALVLLNACTSSVSSPAEPAEQVLQKFKETVRGIEAGDIGVNVKMQGADATDNIDLTFNSNLKIDRRDEEKSLADFTLRGEGSMVAEGQKVEGNVDLGVRIIGDQFYFRLDKLEATDPTVQQYMPLIKGFMGKWMSLASDYVPESVKTVQKDKEKEAALKDLFVNTSLMEVKKEFGVESLEGKKMHHYGIALKKEGVKQYIKQSSAINGQELTDAEVEEAAQFVDSIKNIEVWIGIKDYYLYKGLVELSGQSVDQNVQSDIRLDFVGRSYNEELGITAPEGAEEFNPLALLMGMQMGSLSADGLMEDGFGEGEDITLEDGSMMDE